MNVSLHQNSRPVVNGKQQIVFIMYGIDDLTGGGGAERFFADFFDYYSKCNKSAYSMTMITDRSGYEALRKIGRLTDSKNIKIINKNLLSNTLQVLAYIKVRKPVIVHIPLLAPRYLSFLMLLLLLEKRKRPCFTMTQVDCSTSKNFFCKGSPNSLEERKSLFLHKLYLKLIPFDGIFTWYKKFSSSFDACLVRGAPYVKAANYCFVDTVRFKPAKEKDNLIIFAGRLIAQKGPLFFLKSIQTVNAERPDLLEDWQVIMYGRGPLKNSLQNHIHENQMGSLVSIKETDQLENVYSHSRIYVSAQEHENFTSLAMLEAMACGNAIVARNVGQTYEFVRHGGNGFLLSRDSPDNMAKLLVYLLSDIKKCKKFGIESRRIATEYHTVQNFVYDIESFWSQVLARNFQKSDAI